MEIMYFGPPSTYAPMPAWEAALDDTNVQDFSRLSNPTNPLCCGGTPGTPDQNVRSPAGPPAGAARPPAFLLRPRLLCCPVDGTPATAQTAVDRLCCAPALAAAAAATCSPCP